MTLSRRQWLSAACLLPACAGVRAAADEMACDVLIVGGGVGGFAAALAACRNGAQVVLTEETDWLGGQLTSQAVPPDEHPWIEQFGCTRSYREYRTAVRDFYRANYPLTREARLKPDLNPGNGSVSRLTHEFPVSAAVLDASLLPYVGEGRLRILREHVPISATSNHDRITSVRVRDNRAGHERSVAAKYFLDATELGDLLPMAGCESVTGAESQRETGEMHAASQPTRATAKPSRTASPWITFQVRTIRSKSRATTISGAITCRNFVRRGPGRF